MIHELENVYLGPELGYYIVGVELIDPNTGEVIAFNYFPILNCGMLPEEWIKTCNVHYNPETNTFGEVSSFNSLDRINGFSRKLDPKAIFYELTFSECDQVVYEEMRRLDRRSRAALVPLSSVIYSTRDYNSKQTYWVGHRRWTGLEQPLLSDQLI